MKTITILAAMLCIAVSAFAQRTVSLVSINGMPVNDFKTSVGGALTTGTTYTFVVDYTNQETTGNEVIVKALAGFTTIDANVASEAISMANGQATINFTPLEPISGNMNLQIRTTTSQDFSNSSVDSKFLYTWTLTGDDLSVNGFAKSELSDYSYDAITDTVVLGESAVYSVYNLAGTEVVAGEGDVISLAGVVDGIYILATDKGTAKIVKF